MNLDTGIVLGRRERDGYTFLPVAGDGKKLDATLMGVTELQVKFPVWSELGPKLPVESY